MSENTEELKRKTISGFFWNLAQKMSGQVLGFVVTLVLTRLLLPKEYGVVAIASMVLGFVNLFGTVGLQVSLVQKKDVDELDLSTIFHSGLVLSLILYAIVFVSSPLLASIFHEPQACPVIRVLGLGIVLYAFSGVQNAVITRRLDFKQFFWATLVGNALSAIIGIGMAYYGYGVWALVAQTLTMGVANTLVLFCLVRWYPKWMFSWERFKGMYSFAWKQMAANFIACVSEQARGYVIGIKYTAADLAFYNRGDGLPGLVYNNVNQTIQGVLFPALSKLQDDTEAVKRGLSRSMKISSYLLMPALVGLASVSEVLVRILYTDKWLPTVPFMQIMCIIYCFSMLGGANVQALTAMGRSDIVMKLEMIKRPIMLGVLCITAFISPLAIAIGQCIYCIFICFFNAWPNKKVLGYPIREQVMDIMGNVAITLLMGIAVFAVGLLPINMFLLLGAQLITGVTVYWGLSIITHNENYEYLKSYIIQRIKK